MLDGFGQFVQRLQVLDGDDVGAALEVAEALVVVLDLAQLPPIVGVVICKFKTGIRCWKSTITQLDIKL